MSREARQRVAVHPGARIGVIAASLAAAAALVLPTTALASTQIGSAQGNIACTFSADTVQASSSGASYTIPAGGASITAWFFQAATGDTGTVNLLVWTPAGSGTYTLDYVSPAVNLSDPASTFALATAIPVNPGDLIGLRVSGLTSCVFFTSNPGDTVGFSYATTPLGVPTTLTPAPDLQINVAAAIEVTSNPVPTSADQCKNGGWQTLTDSVGNAFRNQGDCVSFVATKGANLAKS